MEYVQMTLNDWVEMKQKLKKELLGVKQSFVRIGYALRKIEDQKLYEQDGYKSIAEFAKGEYGLEASTTSRFMSINREYSVDGYSEYLRPEYADLGRSQLEEMLKLPEADRQMIQPETPRQEIRELKKFNNTEPVAGVADDLRQLVENFYKDNPEILNAVFSEADGFEEQTIKQFAEIVNPGRNRSYKKGLFFLMMYENRVSVKKFGGNPQDMSWWQFYLMTKDIFGEVAGPDTWQNYFGKEEKGTVPKETLETDTEKESADEKEEKSVIDTVGKEIAPAQKIEENQGFSDIQENKNEQSEDREEEQTPGQMEELNYPGVVLEQEKADETPEPEETENRKSSEEQVTPQSNKEITMQESEGYQTLREETEELAHSVYDVFWEWNEEKAIPMEELKKALENAKKLVDVIENLIVMTDEKHTA